MVTTFVSRNVALGGHTEPFRLAPALVEVVGTRIAAVHTPSEREGLLAMSERARRSGPVIDLGEHLLTPAFVNAHTHLALVALRGLDPRTRFSVRGGDNLVEEFMFRVESSLAPGDVRAFARMGAYESLLSGVGFVWDHYYFGAEVAEALADVGLAGVVAPTLQDLAGPGAAGWEGALETTCALDDDAWAERGVFAALGPHATDTVSQGLWERALELAVARGLPIHAHLAQSIEEHERTHLRTRLTPLRFLRSIGVLERAPSVVLAHAIYVSRAELGLLDPRRHALVVCPASAQVFGFPSDVSRWTEDRARWAVATDCAASNDSMGPQKELRMVAGQRTLAATYSPGYQRFLEDGRVDDARAAWKVRAERFEGGAADATPERLLSRLWSIPGSFHPKVRVGVIEPGALACLAGWNLEHPSLWPSHTPLAGLAMGEPLPALELMVVAGRTVARGRVSETLVTSPGYARARAEASTRLRALLERAGLSEARSTSPT
jgi:5-methylthioadenosine/S-adenosylhomocysteine deaminase